jgi:hypothetical protein
VLALPPTYAIVWSLTTEENNHRHITASPYFHYRRKEEAMIQQQSVWDLARDRLNKAITGAAKVKSTQEPNPALEKAAMWSQVVSGCYLGHIANSAQESRDVMVRDSRGNLFRE